MNADNLIAKAKLFPIASISIIVFVLLILVSYLRGMSDAERQARHEEALQSWERMEEDVYKNSVNLETHLEMAETISQDVKERLIRPSELAKNYQYFYRFEASAGVKITSLQQLAPPPAPPAARASADKAPPKKLFSRVGYTMTMNGSFHQTLEFLRALERGHHFYHLKNFSLQRSAGGGHEDVTLTLAFDLLGTP